MSGPSEIAFDEERFELFPTPVFKRLYSGLEGVNERLAKLCLTKESADGGLVRSNVGSWHSKSDLLKWEDPAIEVFSALLKDCVQSYVAARLGAEPTSLLLTLAIEGWANVSRAGDYAKPHVHPSSNFAVVYYVDAGDPGARAPGERIHSGTLELLDPRNRPEMFQTGGFSSPDVVTFSPKAGMMLIFPSWLYHFVNPYRGERPRISLACNVTVVKVESQHVGGRE